MPLHVPQTSHHRVFESVEIFRATFGATLRSSHGSHPLLLLENGDANFNFREFSWKLLENQLCELKMKKKEKLNDHKG